MNRCLRKIKICGYSSSKKFPKESFSRINIYDKTKSILIFRYFEKIPIYSEIFIKKKILRYENFNKNLIFMIPFLPLFLNLFASLPFDIISFRYEWQTRARNKDCLNAHEEVYGSAHASSRRYQFRCKYIPRNHWAH